MTKVACAETSMPPIGDFKRASAALLEEGALKGPITRLLGRAWARRAAQVARPLEIPGHVASIGVGGATLGGSYRTPVAIALARRLATAGAAVALVSHGYGARLRAARVVGALDDASEVGDESVLAARALSDLSSRALVTSGPTRQAALDVAIAEGARVVVFDGMLQARPRPVTFAVLALDAEQPWGSGAVPPEGDLRAEPDALLGASDAIVTVAHDAAGRGKPIEHVPCAHRGSLRITGARELLTGRVVPLSTFAEGRARVGLSTSIARPDRVRRALAAHDIEPSMIVASADHGPPSIPRAPIDAWLVTEKCATWLHTSASGLSGPSSQERDRASHLVGVYALETTLTAPSLGAFAEAAVLDRAVAAP